MRVVDDSVICSVMVALEVVMPVMTLPCDDELRHHSCCWVCSSYEVASAYLHSPPLSSQPSSSTYPVPVATHSRLYSLSDCQGPQCSSYVEQLSLHTVAVASTRLMVWDKNCSAHLMVAGRAVTAWLLH